MDLLGKRARLMRCRIRIPAQVWTALTSHLRAGAVERFAYLVGRGSRILDPWGAVWADVYVRRAIPVPEDALLVQSPVRVEVQEGFTQQILRGCYAQGLSLIDAHVHPACIQQVAFSSHDHTNMDLTHGDFYQTMPTRPPCFVGSLVLGQCAVAGAFFDPTRRKVHPLDRLTLIGTCQQELTLCPW